MKLNVAFVLKGKTTLKVNNGKAEIAAIAVFELTAVILPNPKYDKPFFEDIGEFLAEHRKPVMIAPAVATSAVIAPAFGAAFVRFAAPNALNLALQAAAAATCLMNGPSALTACSGTRRLS